MAQLTAGSTVGGYPITYQGGPITATTIATTGNVSVTGAITATDTITATGNITAANGSTVLSSNGGVQGLIMAPNGYLDIRANNPTWNNGIILRRSVSNINPFVNLAMNSDTSFHIGVNSATVGMQINTAGNLTVSGAGTFNGGTLNLNNGTSNVLTFAQAGVTAPGDGAAGWKIKLWGETYGFGVNGSTVWYTSANQHIFYTNGGTATHTERFRVDTTGALLSGNLTVNGEGGNVRKKSQTPFARLKASDHVSGHVGAAKGYSDFVVIEGGNKTIAQISVVCGNTAASGTITFDLLTISAQNGAQTSLYTTKPTLTCGGGTVWGNITLPSSTTLNDNTVLVLKVISAPDDCWDLRVDLFE